MMNRKPIFKQNIISKEEIDKFQKEKLKKNREKMYKTTGLINKLIVFQSLYKISNDVKDKISSFYNSKNKTLLEEHKLIKPKLKIESKILCNWKHKKSY